MAPYLNVLVLNQMKNGPSKYVEEIASRNRSGHYSKVGKLSCFCVIGSNLKFFRKE